MKKHISQFFLRGLIAAGFGPVVLAIVYGILGATGVADSFSATEVTKGILSITLMAFIAGGINSIYQIEQLPLPTAIITHAAVLYLDYLILYLFNDWIPRNGAAIGIFSVIFFAGFALVWFIIYLCIRNKTEKINKKLLS